MFNKTENLKNDSATKPFLRMYELIVNTGDYFKIPLHQMKIFLLENKSALEIKTNSKIYKERSIHLYKLAIELLVGSDGFLVEDANKQMKRMAAILGITDDAAKKAQREIFSVCFEKKLMQSLSSFYMGTQTKLDMVEWKKHFKLDAQTVKTIKSKVATYLYQNYAHDFTKNGLLEDEHKHILDRFLGSLGFTVYVDGELLDHISKCELRWEFKTKKLRPLDLGKNPATPLYNKEQVYLSDKISTVKIHNGRIQKKEDAKLLVTDKRLVIVSPLHTTSITYNNFRDISINGDTSVVRNRINHEYTMFKSSTGLDLILLRILVERMVRENIA